MINLSLAVGGRAEEIVVVGEASRIHLTTGSVSGLVGEREIRDLPLNGRSFQQLALLQPGVQAALAAGNDVVGGRTPKISINGARPEQNNFLLDGTDINNVYNKTPGSAAGVLLGVEAVLEFQVLTNAYSAEFGRSAGGVFNAVTRSGANRYTGSVFEFHRNSALDARNFFDPPSQPKPDFTRHQFGGVARRPAAARSHVLLRRLRRADRAARRHRRHGRARRRRAPRHPAGRPGRAASGDSALPRRAVPARQRPLARRRRRRVPVLRNAADRRALLPDPRRSPALGRQQPVRARHARSRRRSMRIPPNKPPISIIDERTRNTYVTGEHQHTFSPNTLNQLRVGLNRSVSLADNRRTIDIPPSMSWMPGEQFGYLTIRGWSPKWPATSGCRATIALNNWQIGDTLICDARAALCCASAARRSTCSSIRTPPARPAASSRSTTSSCSCTGRPSNVDFAVPGKIDPDRRYRQWLFGGFVQDDVRLTRSAVAEPRAALRVRDGADRSRRQDLEPAQRDRYRR